jgi:hypothetical protein
MARKPNVSIGTCPCPVAGCPREAAPIYRFAKRSDKPDPQRKAGKFYGRCPEHGWFGYDGAEGMQKHIRENGTLNAGEKWDAVATPASSSSEPEPPKKPAAPPAPKPAPPPSSVPPKAPRKDLWDL